MKPYLLFAMFIAIVFASCKQTAARQQNDQAKKEPPKIETPKSLKQEATDVSLTSSARGSDLVESIYEELVDKRPELKAIENEIESIGESKGDSVNAFNLYNNKNTSYYNATSSYIDQIKDSALKNRMQQLINNSQSDYTNSIAQHTSLLNMIATKEVALNDIHTALKLMTTMQAVQNYQKTDLPSTKPLTALAKQYDKLTQQAEKLAKQ